MAGDASPSSSKGAGHRKQASLNSLGDDGYSEGGSFSGRDSYMDEREGGMRGFDFDPVRIADLVAGWRLLPCTGVDVKTQKAGGVWLRSD